MIADALASQAGRRDGRITIGFRPYCAEPGSPWSADRLHYHRGTLQAVPVDPNLRSDRELAAQVQAGESRAFASLVAQHGPRVRGRLDAENDPAAATLRVWVRALRQLHGGGPDQEFAPWIDRLADEEADHPAPAPPPVVTGDEIDALWRDLQAYWPTGRRRREPPSWVRPLAVVAALVALAVLVPFATMTALRDDRTHEPAETDLVARPFTGELRESPADPTAEDPELPAFEFPTFDPSVADPTRQAPPSTAEPAGGPAGEPVAPSDPPPADVNDPNAGEEPIGGEEPVEPPVDSSEPPGSTDPGEPPEAGLDDVTDVVPPGSGESGAA